MAPLDLVFHRARPLAGLLFCLSMLPALATPLPLPADLNGLWRVADSACNGCDPSQGAETGAEVRLAASGAQNPFGTDCATTLEVAPLPPESLAALQARLGLPPRWLAGADAGPARTWRLICGGAPRETVILLANGNLLLPGEAGNVLRLLRAR